MGFRTAYKLRGLYPRGPIITRGTLRQAIYALADKMNTFCICWFLILPSKIQNEFRGVVISQDQLPPATAQNFHLTLHGVNIDISWNLILISLRKQLTFCNATFALPIKVWEMSNTLARYSCDVHYTDLGSASECMAENLFLTNQKQYPDLGGSYFMGKPEVVLQNVSCFILRLHISQNKWKWRPYMFLVNLDVLTQLYVSSSLAEEPIVLQLLQRQSWASDG